MHTKITTQIDEVKNEVRQKTMTYIAGGFGLVAGLAWNDAIKSTIDLLFPASGGSIIAKFIYALVITLVVVVVLTSIGRFLNDKTDVLE